MSQYRPKEYINKNFDNQATSSLFVQANNPNHKVNLEPQRQSEHPNAKKNLQTNFVPQFEFQGNNQNQNLNQSQNILANENMTSSMFYGNGNNQQPQQQMMLSNISNISGIGGNNFQMQNQNDQSVISPDFTQIMQPDNVIQQQNQNNFQQQSPHFINNNYNNPSPLNQSMNLAQSQVQYVPQQQPQFQQQQQQQNQFKDKPQTISELLSNSRVISQQKKNARSQFETAQNRKLQNSRLNMDQSQNMNQSQNFGTTMNNNSMLYSQQPQQQQFQQQDQFQSRLQMNNSQFVNPNMNNSQFVNPNVNNSQFGNPNNNLNNSQFINPNNNLNNSQFVNPNNNSMMIVPQQQGMQGQQNKRKMKSALQKISISRSLTPGKNKNLDNQQLQVSRAFMEKKQQELNNSFVQQQPNNNNSFIQQQPNNNNSFIQQQHQQQPQLQPNRSFVQQQQPNSSFIQQQPQQIQNNSYIRQQPEGNMTNRSQSPMNLSQIAANIGNYNAFKSQVSNVSPIKKSAPKKKILEEEEQDYYESLFEVAQGMQFCGFFQQIQMEHIDNAYLNSPVITGQVVSNANLKLEENKQQVLNLKNFSKNMQKQDVALREDLSITMQFYPEKRRNRNYLGYQQKKGRRQKDDIRLAKSELFKESQFKINDLSSQNSEDQIDMAQQLIGEPVQKKKKQKLQYQFTENNDSSFANNNDSNSFNNNNNYQNSNRSNNFNPNINNNNNNNNNLSSNNNLSKVNSSGNMNNRSILGGVSNRSMLKKSKLQKILEHNSSSDQSEQEGEQQMAQRLIGTFMPSKIKDKPVEYQEEEVQYFGPSSKQPQQLKSASPNQSYNFTKPNKYDTSFQPHQSNQSYLHNIPPSPDYAKQYKTEYSPNNYKPEISQQYKPYSNNNYNYSNSNNIGYQDSECDEKINHNSKPLNINFKLSKEKSVKHIQQYQDQRDGRSKSPLKPEVDKLLAPTKHIIDKLDNYNKGIQENQMKWDQLQNKYIGKDDTNYDKIGHTPYSSNGFQSERPAYLSSPYIPQNYGQDNTYDKIKTDYQKFSPPQQQDFYKSYDYKSYTPEYQNKDINQQYLPNKSQNNTLNLHQDISGINPIGIAPITNNNNQNNINNQNNGQMNDKSNESNFYDKEYGKQMKYIGYEDQHLLKNDPYYIQDPDTSQSITGINTRNSQHKQTNPNSMIIEEKLLQQDSPPLTQRQLQSKKRSKSVKSQGSRKKSKPKSQNNTQYNNDQKQKNINPIESEIEQVLPYIPMQQPQEINPSLLKKGIQSGNTTSTVNNNSKNPYINHPIIQNNLSAHQIQKQNEYSSETDPNEYQNNVNSLNFDNNKKNNQWTPKNMKAKCNMESPDNPMIQHRFENQEQKDQYRQSQQQVKQPIGDQKKKKKKDPYSHVKSRYKDSLTPKHQQQREKSQNQIDKDQLENKIQQQFGNNQQNQNKQQRGKQLQKQKQQNYPIQIENDQQYYQNLSSEDNQNYDDNDNEQQYDSEDQNQEVTQVYMKLDLTKGHLSRFEDEINPKNIASVNNTLKNNKDLDNISQISKDSDNSNDEVTWKLEDLVQRFSGSEYETDTEYDNNQNYNKQPYQKSLGNNMDYRNKNPY